MSETTPKPPATESFNLPRTAHGKRVPSHISKVQLARVRHAAYVLPQVVKPADFIPESSPGLEEHLDKLGYILLQKPVSGARPSRWIAPGLIDAALAHLDAVGTGPDTRPLMIERGNVLQAAPEFTRAVVNRDVQGYVGATPFVRWGNLPIILLSLVLALGGGWLVLRGNSKIRDLPTR